MPAILQPPAGTCWFGAYPGASNADPTTYETNVLGGTRELAVYLRYYAFSSGTFPQGTDAAMMASRTAYFSLQNQFGTTYTIKWSAVAGGAYDTQLNAIGAKIVTVGKPCFIGYENEPDDTGKIGSSGNVLGTAADYIAAFQHVATKLRAAAPGLVVMTYVPYGTDANAAACYPGDAYADWIGNDPYDESLSHGSASATYTPMFTWLNSDPLAAAGGAGSGGGHGKPLMITETGVDNSKPDASIAAWLQGGGSFGTGVPATLAGLSTTWGSQVQLWQWFNSSGTLGNCEILTGGTMPLTIAAMESIGATAFFNPGGAAAGVAALSGTGTLGAAAAAAGPVTATAALTGTGALTAAPVPVPLTFTGVYQPLYGPLYTSAPAGGFSYVSDSLIIADSIELIGAPGGIPSADPRCPGATFRLMPGFDLSAPQPTTDIVGSLLLDGERPFGYRASNRTMVLPVQIRAPDFWTLTAAREVLLQAVNSQTWTLRWTRDTTGPLAGTQQTTGLPLLFDCFRAEPSVVKWGGLDTFNRQPYGLVTLTFQALPYGRSDAPVVVNFTSPLAGYQAPSAPVVIDSYSSVAGTQWFQSLLGPGAFSAHWDPDAPPSGWQVTWHGNGSTANPGAESSLIGGITAGKSYQGQSWFYSPQGWATGVQVNILWYTAGSVYISTGAGPVTAPLAAGVSVLVSSGLLTAPATATQARIVLQGVGTPGAGVLFYAMGAPSQGGFLSQPPITWIASGSSTVTTLSAWANSSLLGSTLTGAGQSATYTTTGIGPFNLAGMAAITLYAGFGSTAYFPVWCRAGGPVQFRLTLTDGTNTLSLATTKTVKGSNNDNNPLFHKIRIPIPQATVAAQVISLGAVTGYTLQVVNRGTNDMRYTDLYIDSLTAVPPPVPLPSPVRGTVYDLAGIAGSARAPASWQFQQAGGPVLQTRTLTSTGAGSWVCPYGVTSVAVYGVGGGGAGGDQTGSTYGGGGGGGGSAYSAAVGVTAGQAYPFQVGAKGQPANAGLANGGDTFFTGDTVTVTAHGGISNPVNTGAGAAGGAAGTGGYAGGHGGSGESASGGGGGSSGGSASAGITGNNGSAGGAGGAAVTGGGKGGNGEVAGGGTAGAGSSPGGGGSGAGWGGRTGGAWGGGGELTLTYLGPPTFQTLIAHRPSPDAPASLSPFVSPGSADLPDGTTEYPVPSLVPGLSARFGGTYTIVLVNNTWNSPSSARNLTVTVKQYEQASGAVWSTAVTLTGAVPSSLPSAMVVIGELTLPLKDIPPDNYDAYFTVTVTDTNTADTFLDVLVLDTMGQPLMIQSATSSLNYFADEPATDRDLGLVMGTVIDRGDAI
ncbi:MAG: hypothetical protein ACLP5E_03555, partial [Streptosporangiaceae bacterium]